MMPKLAGARVAVDVQHLYRTDKPSDRGAFYQLPGGLHVWEAALSTIYAAALADQLRQWGAQVLTNDPSSGILTGTYFERNRAADAWGAQCYLACHVNEGAGNYARGECLAESSPATWSLARLAVSWIPKAVPEVQTYSSLALARGTRGRICVEGGSRAMSAVIVEPFFGDSLRFLKMAPLTDAPRLVQIGKAIALGVADWWGVRGLA